MLKNIDLGEYLNSYFFIKLQNSNIDFEHIRDTSPETHSTLLHEYVHFLQDIFTTYGYYRIVDNSEILKTYIHKIYDLKEIKIPITIPYIEDSAYDINQDLASIYTGETGNLGFKFDNILSVNKEGFAIKDHEHIKGISITVQNSETLIKSSFLLGSRIILECMASIIEKKYFISDNVPNFPYNFFEYLYSFYISNSKYDPGLMIALAECSLKSYHPAKLLIELLEMLRDKSISINSYDDIYTIAKKFWCNSSEFLNVSSFSDLHKKMNIRARKCLNDYFINNEFRSVRDWIDALFMKALTVFKDSNGFPILRLYEEGGVFYKRLCNFIGFPIISNSDDIYYVPNEAPDSILLLKAIPEVFKILNGQSKGCSLQDHCQSNYGKHTVDSNCYQSPWKRVEYKEWCYFAQLWKFWKLDEYKVSFSRE